MFSAYIMLQLGKEDARRLILGSAYQYKADVVSPQVPLTKYADEHGIPAQRFFNVLCIAYGADQKLFADVVEKGYLPKKRAEGCDLEYEQTAFAFKKLIGPYIDQNLAKKVLATWMRDVSARPSVEAVRGCGIQTGSVLRRHSALSVDLHQNWLRGFSLDFGDQ